MNIRIHSTAMALLMAMGLGLTSHGSSQAATADNPETSKPFPAITLGKRMRGEQAVQALKDRLHEVAARHGMTGARFAKMLREDRHAWLDKDARLFYIDDFPPPPEQADVPTTGGTATTEMAGLEQTFALHSRPGAKRVIYLDFDGNLVSNTAWNNSYAVTAIDAKPFDLDGIPSAFSDTELQRIQNIWRRVAEDYAPFDVDVTTEEPLPDAIARSGSTDQDYGTRVMVTRDWTKLTSSPCGCGGFAYVGVFNYTSETYKPAWVFFDNLGSGNEKYVAEAISHEAGHNLGLSHDGYNNGTTSVGYYQGHGSGATGWAPIMGVGYYKELTQWSKGEYAYASQTQDDLVLIQNYGAPLRTDDHGDSPASATPLAESSGNVTGSGVIGSRNDVDVFAFFSGTGNLNFSVTPAAIGPNLDIAVALFDDVGNQLAYSNPADALNASISLANVPAGTYYLVVDGFGKGDASVGYTDYASLGEYVVSGTIPSVNGVPPVAIAAATPTSGTTPLVVTFSSAGSHDPDGGSLSYDWNFGDGTAHSNAEDPSHTYTSAGNYTATLTVTDASGISSQAQVNVTVKAVLASVRVDNITLATSSTKRGTKATATVKITDTTGKIISGASVTGVWSGVVSGTTSGATGSTGTVKFTSPTTKTSGTFTFSVTAVSATGYNYDQTQNKETSDSVTR
jgi:PKD repeat protein